MEIKTKFAIGDTVWRIENSKAKCFVIGCIVLYDGKVCYGTAIYDMVSESCCFATKEELIKYVFNDGDENV